MTYFKYVDKAVEIERQFVVPVKGYRKDRIGKACMEEFTQGMVVVGAQTVKFGRRIRRSTLAAAHP